MTKADDNTVWHLKLKAKEAYAKGYKQGQADLIEKICNEKFIIKLLNEYERIPDLMTGSYTKYELLRNEQQRIDVVKEAIKRASESARGTASPGTTKGSGLNVPAPEKPSKKEASG